MTEDVVYPERRFPFNPEPLKFGTPPRLADLLAFAEQFEGAHPHLRQRQARAELGISDDMLQILLNRALENPEAWQIAPEFLTRRHAQRERNRARRVPSADPVTPPRLRETGVDGQRSDGSAPTSVLPSQPSGSTHHFVEDGTQ